MRVKSFLLMLVAGMAATLAGCGSVDSAVPVGFVDICAEDDRWISAEGILGLADQTTCESIGDSQQCHIVLLNPDDSSQSVTVTIEVGDGANQMASLPTGYSDADLAVQDNVGSTHGAGDRVKVTGPASNNEAQYACRVWVRRIETVP